MKHHTYEVQVDWTGNQGAGTKGYKSYRRDHTVRSEGKPLIHGSSDPAFCGNATRYNPEELLVASLSACHMLWYLHLCSVNQVSVLDYRDAASGVMQEFDDGSGAFVRVLLRPTVEISAGDDRVKALALHQDAHCCCFVANSVKFPVDVAPDIKRASGAQCPVIGSAAPEMKETSMD